MQLIVKTSTEIPKSWDENLLKNNSSTGYQLSSWGKIYQESYNSTPLFLEIKNGNDVVAQLLVLIHKEYSWRDTNFLANMFGDILKIKKSLGWIYGPIVFDSTHYQEILEIILKELDDIAEKNNVNTIRGTIPPMFELNTEPIFKKFGYNNTPWATYIINLQQDEKSIFSQLDKKTRYDIRKSEKNSLKFEIGTNFNSILDFNKIKQNSKNATKYSDSITNSKWKNLYNTNNGKLFLTKLNDEYVGGISTLTFNKNIVQHGVGNIKTSFLGGTFLTWNLIKWGIKEKFRSLDLGGINPNPKSKKEQQISFYKSKWGGKKFEYNIYTKVFDHTKFKIATVLQNPYRLTNFLKSK